MTVCPKCKFYNICKGRLNETVENCVRFKSAEQTNEGWFCSLTTEEKARFIADNDGTIQIGDEVEYQNTMTKWSEWLKEKHKRE